MHFVSGITGNVGGAVARHLLARHAVRALVRDPLKAAEWSQKGVDVRQGDFNDAAAVAAAMTGVEGAFLMLPPLLAPAPGFPETKAITASFREALRQAPPLRLVVLSSIGSQQSSGVGLITATHLLEEALHDLSIPIALIRAGSFMRTTLWPPRAWPPAGFSTVSRCRRTAGADDRHGGYRQGDRPPAGRRLAWQENRRVRHAVQPGRRRRAMSEASAGRCRRAASSARSLGGRLCSHGHGSSTTERLRGDAGRDQFGLDRLRTARHRAGRRRHSRQGLRASARKKEA